MSTISKNHPSGNSHTELLSPADALTVAAKACSCLLMGTPPRDTFNPAHLNQAMLLLTQMVATIQPIAPKKENTGDS